MVNSFVFEARMRRVRDAQLNRRRLRGASMSITQAPLEPPARCIWLLRPSRSREREMESASTGASSSAHPSAVNAIPNSLARTAAQGNGCARTPPPPRVGGAVCLSGAA